MDLKKLIAMRKAFLDKLNALLNLATTESRELTDDESSKYDEYRAEIEGLDRQITLHQERENNERRQRELEDSLNTVDDHRHLADPSTQGDVSEGERKDISGYSFIKAIRSCLPTNLGGEQLSGLELEMHQEAVNEARNSGSTVGGLGIPQVILAHARQFRNDLTVTGGSGGDQGGVTVDTELRSVIDILREKLRVREMGATVLTDLVGNVQFPKAISDGDPTEKGENETADENSPTFGSVSLSPHRLPVFAEVSKQLLMQSSMDVEAWLRNYLAFRIASRMDKMAINGSGSGDQPLGILNTTGIGLVAGGTNGLAPTRDHVIKLAGEVADDNAEEGNLGYLTTTKVKTKLQLTKVDAGSGQFVWKEGTSTLNGYKALTSTNVPSNLTKGSGTDLSAVIYGNWASLMIGQWGGLDVLVNPYSKDTEGLIRVNMSTFYDVAVQHAESFAVMKDAITTV